MRALVLVIAVGLVACGEPGLKGLGEPCTASSECADGLLCDTGITPHVCAMNLTVFDAMQAPDAQVDAPPGAPDAPIDAATPVPDAPVPDAPVPDAALPDAV